MRTSIERAYKDIEHKENNDCMYRRIIFYKNPFDDWEYRVAYFFDGMEANIWTKARCEEYEALGLDYMVETAVVDFKNA